MKKLMIAAAIVCAAAISQAASFEWKSSGTSTKGVVYDGTADAKAYATYGAVTLYLFDAATYSQDTAFADLVGGKFDTSKAVSSQALNSNSKIENTEFTYGTIGQNYSFYAAAIFDNDPNTFYISSLKADQKALESGSTSFAFEFKAETQTTLDASAGFKGAGVYAAAVPEPTSGLLLLLGIAGMALRRRRA